MREGVLFAEDADDFGATLDVAVEASSELLIGMRISVRSSAAALWLRRTDEMVIEPTGTAWRSRGCCRPSSSRW